jgi:hypothetical protein
VVFSRPGRTREYPVGFEFKGLLIQEK